MRRMFGATAAAGALSLVARAGAAQMPGGQRGGMMGDMNGYGRMGGYGGPWVLILLVIIAVLLVWMIARGRNKH